MRSLLRVVLIAAIALATAIGGTARAQDKVAGFAYLMSLPGSETETFIDEPSFLGGELFLRLPPFYGTPFLIGVNMGWQVFHSESDDPLQFDNGTISGTQRRYLNTFPILFTGHWYFGPKEGVRVFAGGGIGPTYVIQSFGIGVFDFENGEWHFTLAPELGVQVPMGSVELYVSARYNHAFSSGQYVSGEGEVWNSATLGVGLAWSGW